MPLKNLPRNVLADQVLAFFTANPDEELTVNDVTVKFDVDDVRTASAKLSAQVRRRVLVREGDTYRAGPALQKGA
ncbi:hypothetical protein [uncultured Azohydromonas sp.]|jgi:hypothetical protein|uniref:hypothetical protein n=1 Tax=uncultured Azohydromonas sp. TaxID=487342 RepID=UPI0026269E86|nr:hypothetical protein [uncultured Azohydromonas sp.]